MKWKIKIPAIFANDHAITRDIESGIPGKETERLWEWTVNAEELLEWLNDARHYSDCNGLGWDFEDAAQLQRSARATVSRIEKFIRAMSFNELEWLNMRRSN